jgi:DNA (cytosine-5)-methyltransferase 1
MKHVRQPRFIDLFCGIGGIRLAFESAGCRCIFSSDWDLHAQRTYSVNFGESPAGDIRQITSSVIPDHEILVAGFPCQPFSISGVSKKKSLGRAHGFRDRTQGTLFFEVARILGDKRPDAFVLENVKNLKGHDGGRTFRVILQTLEEELGYSVDYRILDASAFVPQHRERIFIVGFRHPRRFEWPPFPSYQQKIADILEASPDDKYTLSDRLWSYLQGYAKKHREAGHGFGFGLVKPNGIARTLSARYYKDGSEILVPGRGGRNPRRLTPRECARLMGFPESFRIPVSDTQAYRQFGNSVVVPMVETIAKQVVAALGKPVTTSPKQLSLLSTA